MGHAGVWPPRERPPPPGQAGQPVACGVCSAALSDEVPGTAAAVSAPSGPCAPPVDAPSPAPLTDRVAERRLEITMATTTIRTAPSATPTRSPMLWLYLTTLVATSSDTRFITLSSGLLAGPAVSLNGSPTVSPMTVAACASLPLPP